MKSRLMILSVALVAMLAAASLAMANPYGRGPGAWMPDIPQEKQEQVAKLYREGRQTLTLWKLTGFQLPPKDFLQQVDELGKKYPRGGK